MTRSIKEQEEFLRLSQSSSLKADMRYIAAHRHNPLLVDGTVDLDRLIAFLTEYNEFINHQPKPFKPMIDKVMKL
jgi:hypothetical protein